MALATHQMQGHGAFPSRFLSWTKETKLRQFVTTLHVVKRSSWHVSQKHNFFLSVGVPHVRGSKNEKPLKISAFKGSARNGESGGRASGSKSPKNPIELSYIPQDSGETTKESSKVQNVPFTYSSQGNETMAGSPAIHNLFKKWLAMLRTQSPSRVRDEIFEEEPSPSVVSETQNGAAKKETNQIWKTVWCSFLCVDLTIKIPLLVFFPWYLAVNVVYGSDVSKELMPLWVFGPFIVALYIKMLRGLCALYIFSFKQTVKVVKNLPTFYHVAYDYIAHGKLKEYVGIHFWQRVMDIKNLDYKELSRRKLKDLEEWIYEKYLDFVESIWPYYCRTIKMLKRANLI